MMLGLDKDRYFQVGAQLPPIEKEELLGFLRENIDVFAWSAYKAPKVDIDLICHHLNVILWLYLKCNRLSTLQRNVPRL